MPSEALIVACIRINRDIVIIDFEYSLRRDWWSIAHSTSLKCDLITHKKSIEQIRLLIRCSISRSFLELSSKSITPWNTLVQTSWIRTCPDPTGDDITSPTSRTGRPRYCCIRAPLTLGYCTYVHIWHGGVRSWCDIQWYEMKSSMSDVFNR